MSKRYLQLMGNVKIKGQTMFKTIATTTAIMLSTTAIQALDGKYTGGPGASQSIGKALEKQSKRDWVHEDHGCGLDCREASAPATKGVPGYAFKLLTTRHNALATARGNGLSGSSNGNSKGSGCDNGLRGNSGLAMHTVTSEPFGVFYNLQECDIARAQKIAELDAKGERQPHYPPNAPKNYRNVAKRNRNRNNFRSVGIRECIVLRARNLCAKAIA